MAARYYSPDDPESYVTPSQLKRLGQETQVAYLVHWFLTHYEDPANETPHDSREGGYQYIWGGPYDALDELSNEFGKIVPDVAIEAAVEEVQREGIHDWAPGQNHPDQIARRDEAMAEHFDIPPPTLNEIRRRLNRGVQPRLGGIMEVEERNALRSEIAMLREILEQATPRHGGIGHNNPAEELRLPVDITIKVTVAINEMDAELSKPVPDVAAVVRSAGKLGKILAWIGKKLDKSVDGFATASGAAAFAVGIADLAGLPVSKKIGEVFNTALTWLDIVTVSF